MLPPGYALWNLAKLTYFSFQKNKDKNTLTKFVFVVSTMMELSKTILIFFVVVRFYLAVASGLRGV